MSFPSKTQKTLALYKQIMKAAKAFPSIKRDKIAEEIRLGFRENRHLPNALMVDDNGTSKESQEGYDKYQECINVAIKGLSQLEQFSNISKQGQNWTVYLEDNPMPDNRAEEDKVKFTKTD